MSIEAPASCTLQIAARHRAADDPYSLGPENDICDVSLWLREKYRLHRVHVWVEQHFGHRGDHLADVHVLSLGQLERLSPIARDAFRALGYSVKHLGSDTYGYEFCDGCHSNHRVMQAYVRIETAMRSR